MHLGGVKKIVGVTLSQWSEVGDGYFVPSSRTSKILPAGKYSIEFGLSGVFFKPLSIVTDSLVEIQDSLAYKVLKDSPKRL